MDKEIETETEIDMYTIIDDQKFGVELNLSTVPNYCREALIELIDDYYELYAIEEDDELLKDLYVEIHLPYDSDILIYIIDRKTRRAIDADCIDQTEVERTIRQAKIKYALRNGV